MLFNLSKKQRSPILWTHEEAIALTGGASARPWVATGISIAVDDVVTGDLFFAALGDDLDKVFAKGAAAAVVPAHMKVSDKHPTLRVGNSYEALRIFSRSARYRSSQTLIALQNTSQKRKLASVLEASGESIYIATDHASQSLAALPEGNGVSIFGMSPTAMPHITVIDKPDTAIHSRVFSSMPRGGIVLMDIHANGANHLISSLKSQGIDSHHIFSFEEVMQDKITWVTGYISNLLKMIAQTLSSHTKLEMPDRYAAFKIKQRIDTKFLNKTLILDGLKTPSIVTPAAHELTKALKIPRSLNEYQLVCHSKHAITTGSEQSSLPAKQSYSEIITDVARPGDVLLFKTSQNRPSMAFAKALRRTA